jgi:acid phosphatase (class A)
MHSDIQPPSRRQPIFLILAALAAMAPASLAAQPPATARATYLEQADIGLVVPPPPAPRSATARADLAAVRRAQPPRPEMRDEAFTDAAAYSYDQLLPRFSVAAGTELDLHTRPILAHMLRWALKDVSYYVGKGKAQAPRPRPYVEDPSIIPCETDYLRPTDNQSYPSGHAANGELAGLLLAAVMPERGRLVRARGLRYGDNRIVCGVHHPIDIAEGRHIADVYYARAAQEPQFKADLACAVEEHQASLAVRTGRRPPYSAACQALSASAVAEARQQEAAAEREEASFDPK